MIECDMQSSEIKDSQMLRMLEHPLPSSTLSTEKSSVPVTHNMFDEEDDDMFLFTHSTFNLLTELWNPSRSMLQNLKIIIGYLQTYIISQGKIDPSAIRVREAGLMKDALVNILNACKKRRRGKGCTSACTVDDLNLFLMEEKLTSIIMEDIMIEQTFREWTEEFKGYTSRRPRTDPKVARSSCVTGGGMNALFSTACLREEETEERLPQYIAKTENGRLHTVRTPGEVGQSLIHLDVYDVRDILRRDKRDWWKYAKVRTQILTSSPSDPKYQLVKQFMDLAADDLMGVLGLRKEVSGLAQ